MSELTALLIERLASLAPTTVEVADDSAKHAGHAGNTGGGHLSAKIVSNAFSGLSTVARHRAVYRLVADLMPARIHALADHQYARRTFINQRQIQQQESSMIYRQTLATALLLAVMGTLAVAQTAAKKPAAAAAAAAAKLAAGGDLVSQAQFDLILKERMGQGQPDSPELRRAAR
jgi:BolA protein